MFLKKEEMLSLYETMVKIRDFEETSKELMLSGKLAGFLHMYVGEEAIATGVCSELTNDDCICSTHRGHGHIIAKGGITSSDIATAGLRVKRARVAGQILPGVPVWQLGSESKYENMTYIVFPGNVGEVDALTAVMQKLENSMGEES